MARLRTSLVGLVVALTPVLVLFVVEGRRWW
jgi:hypothetical protein